MSKNIKDPNDYGLINESELILDLKIEEDLNQMKEEVLAVKTTLKLLEEEIKFKKKELERVEKEYKYYGGFKRYLYTYLNKAYHTMILVGFMFLGYTISGFKNIGLKVWNSPTSIVFYIVFTVGFVILTLLEYLREKDKKEGE